MILVQFLMPIQICPYAPSSLRSWRLLVIKLKPVTVMEFKSTTLAVPQTLDAVQGPQGIPGGVPATYRVLPLRRPMVAAFTGMLTPGVFVFRSKTVTLAADPPHSGPQLRM